MTEFSRRTFMTVTGAGLAAAAARSASGANARLRHAVFGLGGQGRRHAAIFNRHPDCEVVALCDVDTARLERAKTELGLPTRVGTEQDYRRVLDDDGIDSVSIATPDHWHTKLALHALEAGKHVYVEKPCSHTIEEARILMDAAGLSGKCVQHGTQSRGSEGIRKAIQYLREGHLGTIRAAKAINHQLRGPIGRAAPEDPPEGVDYDMWLGPAPAHPFTRNRWHYNWHWFWDYGCGDIGNDGIHQLDQVRWGLGVGLPNAISGSGGQLFYDDDHQTPDTQVITYEYDASYIIYEMRLWTEYPLEGHDNGVVFYGDGGKLEIGRDGCHVTPTGEPRKKVGDAASFDANVANFIEAVRDGDPARLLSPIAEGAISTALCHLGNIVTRTGQRLHFDAETWRFGTEEANAYLGKDYREGYGLPGLGA